MTSAFVGGEHAGHDLRVLGEEFLAHVQDAEGIGGRVAEEELRAFLELGRGHHRVEPGPGVHVAAAERGLAVGVLQQDGGDVGLAQAVVGQRADQEDVRVGAAGDGDGLPLRSATVAMPLSGRVTSAVHSGFEKL